MREAGKELTYYDCPRLCVCIEGSKSTYDIDCWFDGITNSERVSMIDSCQGTDNSLHGGGDCVCAVKMSSTVPYSAMWTTQ